MAAMSVAPISRHTRSFGARCYSTDVEVADTFCFKMIIGVCEGQTNKHDTLIAERDWSFILSTHPRLPSREKSAGILRRSRQVLGGTTILTIWRGRIADARIGAKCWFSHDQPSYY